ncbi:lytic transglycosylase domain-containing protein [Hufsiella ginkgonis]|nr:lytic transglycosylase domain-containing protein [Hufsiella ginkgonis]
MQSGSVVYGPIFTPGKNADPVKPAGTFSFADENIPQGDAKVVYRMQKALNAHAYGKLQTRILHYKAAKWFPVIEPILERYGIPQDFKYIALVESGLREGTSHRGASGYWQFMPGTARSYGLKVNRSMDERQDMEKSTVAACKYIRELYGELRSWTLTAAAYNLGDSKLKVQISRQNQNNYFKMKLNRETAGYVYKIISMKEIIENPARYGYTSNVALLAEEKSRRPFYYSLADRNTAQVLQLGRN